MKNDIMARWEKSTIMEVTPEEAFKLRLSNSFYNTNAYYWEGKPSLNYGEIGYDDILEARICVIG